MSWYRPGLQQVGGKDCFLIRSLAALFGEKPGRHRTTLSPGGACCSCFPVIIYDPAGFALFGGLHSQYDLRRSHAMWLGTLLLDRQRSIDIAANRLGILADLRRLHRLGVYYRYLRRHVATLR